VNRVRIAVAGLGRMGTIHAASTCSVPGVELAVVVDADHHVARAAGERFGVAWSTDYAALVGDPGIDAMIVATPTALHGRMVAAAATAGKHVLCEKPIAGGLEEAVDVLDVVARAGVKLQVGFHRRFDPDWEAMAQRIAGGEIGEAILYRASLRDRCPPSPEYLRASAGIFRDMAIHELDAARWLIGEVEEAAAYGANSAELPNGELGTALVVLRFAGGALGALDASRVAGYGYEDSAEVVGTRGTMRLRGNRATQLARIDQAGSLKRWVPDWATEHREAYLREVEAFAVAIREGSEPRATGADAVAAAQLAEACVTAHRERRTVRVAHQAMTAGAMHHAQH
jgi:predicted dehydrogenase